MFVSPQQASNYYQVSKETLRRWCQEGQLKYITTSGGHRRYEIKNESGRRKIVFYRNKKYLSELKNKYPLYDFIKDIGNGYDFDRKSLVDLINEILDNKIGEIVLYKKSELVNAGFNLIKSICDKYETKITLLSKDSKIPENETVDYIKNIL